MIYVVLKIAFTWPIAHIVWSKPLSTPGSWIGKLLLFPSMVAPHNLNLFCAGVIIVLLILLIIPVTYATSIFLFWITLNIYRMNFPVANGSDYMMLMSSVFTIFFPTKLLSKNENITVVQRFLHNLSMIFLQLQVVWIYLISGWDKLFSEAWQSGSSLIYVAHIETMFRPSLVAVLSNPAISFMLSWATILFELAFVVLVWFRSTRLIILAIGVLFHLSIWVLVSLPDFAIMMIATYLVFLKDEDVERLRLKIR
jgi:hypothetical protein